MAYYETGRDPSLPPVHESVRRKRRWGCACGCAFFLLLVLFGVMGVTYWILRPQAAVPKELILPPKAIGFGVVRLGANDPGIKDLSRFLLDLVEKSQSITDANQARAASLAVKTLRTFINQLVQGDAVLALVPAETDASANPDTSPVKVIFGFSTRNHLGTLIGQILLRGRHGSGVDPRSFNGGYIVEGTKPGQQSPVGWQRNLMLFGSEASLVEGVMDRVGTNQSVPVDLDLQDILDQIQFSSPPTGQDMAFGMVLRPGMLKDLVRQVAKSRKNANLEQELNAVLSSIEMSWDDAQGMAITGDVVNADSIRLEIRIVMARPEAAKKLLTALDKAYEQASDGSERAKPGEISFRRDMKTIGSVLSVTITMSNITSWIVRNTKLGASANATARTVVSPSAGGDQPPTTTSPLSALPAVNPAP